ncbi:hypothetical protein KKH3_05840 [Pectobacterium actinidiae]|nr:hypothetical protein KKH3_05840 [Pectobacterium actinidiae]
MPIQLNGLFIVSGVFIAVFVLSVVYRQRLEPICDWFP